MNLPSSIHPVFIVIAIVLTLIIGIAIAAAIWWNYGWAQSPIFTTGEPVTIPLKNQDISRIRFKNCEFTISINGSTATTYDVTDDMNRIARSYNGSHTNLRAGDFSLYTGSTGLNPFTFTIPGVNDMQTLGGISPEEMTIYASYLDDVASKQTVPAALQTQVTAIQAKINSSLYRQVMNSLSNPNASPTLKPSTAKLTFLYKELPPLPKLPANPWDKWKAGSASS